MKKVSNLLLVAVLCLNIAVTPIESHFFRWAWNKFQHAIDPNKPQRPFDCGLSDIQPKLPAKFEDARVTGGASAVDHSFPWTVNVINMKSMKSCGGTIISSNIIVTAAHCIVDEPQHIKVIAGAATLLGRLNLFNYYSVSDVFIHPEYVACCDYDLAIIKLKKNLERSSMINSICLPDKIDQELEPETKAIVTGWGGKYPSSELNVFGSFHLKQGLVYIQSRDTCKRIYPSFDDNDEICATNIQDAVDTREGDSGGPLMIRNETDHRWYLFGITSHGSNGQIIRPGVYSSVSRKLDFIRKYLQ